MLGRRCRDALVEHDLANNGSVYQPSAGFDLDIIFVGSLRLAVGGFCRRQIQVHYTRDRISPGVGKTRRYDFLDDGLIVGFIFLCFYAQPGFNNRLPGWDACDCRVNAQIITGHFPFDVYSLCHNSTLKFGG